jgi:WD40 repeat protein
MVALPDPSGAEPGTLASESATTESMFAGAGSSFDPGQPVEGLPAHGYMRLDGHEDAVWSVALSRDGRTAVSGSMDGTVRAWDVPGGRGQRVLVGHALGIVSVSISADGRRILSGSLDGTFRLWDAESGDLIWTGDGHGAPVHAVAFCEASDALLSAGADGNVYRWRFGDRNDMTRISGPGGRVNAIAASPGGSQGAAGTASGRVWMFDVRSGKMVSSACEGFRDRGIRSVTFAQNGLLAAGGESGRIAIFDSTRLIAQGKVHDDWVRGLAFTESGLLSVGDDETLRESSEANGWAPGAVIRAADESLLAVAHAGGVTVVGSDTGAVYVRREGVTPP